MRLKQRITKIATFALLCLLTHGEPELAFADWLGDSNLQLAQAQSSQPIPQNTQPIWGVNCAGTKAGLECRAIQAVKMTDSGVLSVAVRVLPETKKPQMLLLLPLGIHLPAGVTLKFGEEEAKAIQLKNCDAAGCLAEYAITDAEIGALAKGQPLTVLVQDPDQKSLSVQVPAAGFAAAYAKIK
jgi:invasion protein IalB